MVWNKMIIRSKRTSQKSADKITKFTISKTPQGNWFLSNADGSTSDKCKIIRSKSRKNQTTSRPFSQKVQKGPKSLKMPHVQKFELGREYYKSIDLGELYKLCSHRTRIYTKCQTLKIFFHSIYEININ